MEENGSAVYSSFPYVVEKSLECLNRAIDKKVQTEINQNKKQLTLYEVLRLCKDRHVFDDITSMVTEELVDLIIRTTSCDPEVAKEIVKKPISYLTKSHDNEEEYLRNQIKDLESHDRKKYLISLYKEFRKAVLPIYQSKKHSISKDNLVKDPRVKLDCGCIKVTDGDGEKFNNAVYFISDKGFLYRRTISSCIESEIIIETSHNDEIVGFVTDQFSHLEVNTKFSYEGWSGKSVFDLSTLTYDKRIVNLRDEEGEKIVEVKGLLSLSESQNSCLKSKLTKTSYIKE